MRALVTYLPETMDKNCTDPGCNVRSLRRDLVCAFTIAVLVGCSGAKTDGMVGPGSGATADGGSSGSPASGGASSGPMSSGGSSSAPAGTSGSTPPPSASSGGGSVVGGSSSGATSAPDGAGGASSGGQAGGSSGGPGDSGSKVDSGSSGGPVTSTCGDAGAPSYPLTPPVPDSASKVPVSNAGAGYTVEGNIAYGALTSQRLDVIYPVGAGPKGTQVLPAVVMFHGGGWIHSYTNNSGNGKDHMSTFFDRFLAHGFMVCNAEYRVADGTPDGAVAPAAVEDALLAAKWCWDHLDYYHGDRARYVVTGGSAGGHLSLMVGMAPADSMLGPTNPCDFKIAAIVDGYGIADVENLVGKGSFTDIWLPPSLPNRAAVAKQVNPMTYVRKDIPPLIVVQGANDSTAPIADSQHLVALLTAAGADATMHTVPGAGHGFATPASAWPDAEKAMFDWLVSKGISK